MLEIVCGADGLDAIHKTLKATLQYLRLIV